MLNIRVESIRNWFNKHSSLIAGITLGCLTLIGGVLRAYHIGFKSLWYDEAVVYWISKSNLSSLVGINAQLNSAPPLYVFLIHFVSQISSNEATLRSISWLAGTLSIPLIYFLALRYVSKSAAFATVIIFVVTPVYIEYSQQLREYSLAFLLSVLMFLVYNEFKKKGSWSSLALLVATFLVGLILQYGLALLILSFNLAFIIEVEWCHNKVVLLKWVTGQVAILLAVAWIWVSTLHFQYSLGGFSYLASGYFKGSLPSLPAFLYRQTYDIVLFAFPDPPLVILLMGTGLIGVLAYRSSLRKYANLVIPFIVAAVAGILSIYPYLGARQAIYLFPIICIFIAMGFDYILRVDKKGIVAVLLVILVVRAAFLSSVGYLRSEGIENLKPLVQQLTTDLQASDRIFICNGAIPAFRYYFRGDLGQVVEGAPTEDWQKQFSAILDTSSRVWLVASHCGDVSTYVNFAARRRPIEEVGSKYQAWLYLSP